MRDGRESGCLFFSYKMRSEIAASRRSKGNCPFIIGERELEDISLIKIILVCQKQDGQ